MNYPIEEKSIQELVKEASERIEALKNAPEMTEEDIIMYDAEYRYFQDEDD